MRRKTLVIGVAAGALTVAAASGGIAIAAGTGGGESPLTGTELERATSAALATTGRGTVVEAETGDGGAAYEVEIRLDDGRQVEVQLDDTFAVTGREADDDGAAGEDDGPEDSSEPGDS